MCGNKNVHANVEQPASRTSPNAPQTNFMYRTDIESGRVDIFDFSMNRASQGIECHSDETDGNHYLMCNYDDISLNNGVYFCRLKYGNSEVWNKLMIARD